MKRIWSIEEQTVKDQSTGFVLEFTSAVTEASKNEEDPPEHDQGIALRIINEGRTRVAVFEFDRNGQFVGSTVDLITSEVDTAPVST